ncbi:sialidase family protein [uncultured Draconibacterium sp.]|uniref:sialidase family protein n=1 Tax=uncultured Draconibacterium sp. TaxID=1573823 RepID=UPI00321655CB
MSNTMVKVFVFLFVFVLSAMACSKENESIEESEIPAIVKNLDGIRIAWDYSSRVRIAPLVANTEAYCGYARLKQLHNGILACVYETSSGNVELVFSSDLGQNWGASQTIFFSKNNCNMAVPDIIELSDNSIIVACNPRPKEPYSDDRKFGIKVRKSTDGGISWQDEQLVYEAQSTFDNGCWEPSLAQLPNEEVQLYFSNEGIYTSSNEQNISMLKSTDLGETWSAEPIIVGFRQGCRDGMPVPLVLGDKGEILVAVEDNKVGEFKPSIYHEKIADNWAGGYVAADDSRRDYHPLEDEFPEAIYAGAPYLARLKSGEVLLSYQSTWNRSNLWDRSCQHVEVGNNSGTQFQNRSVPFTIPLTNWGLWNSIAVIEDGSIPVAITSTNAYSSGATEVWMIKGHVIPEFSVPVGTAIVDGVISDECWQNEWPYFIGHKSETNVSASMVKDATYLYLSAVIKNSPAEFEKNGQLTFQIDTERKGYEKPHKGIFSFECRFDGTVKILEGNYGEWEEKTASAEMKYKVIKENALYQFELAIPLQMFPANISDNTSKGINFHLSFQTNKGSVINESISTNNSEKPYTWSPVKFNLNQ